MPQYKPQVIRRVLKIRESVPLNMLPTWVLTRDACTGRISNGFAL